MFIFKICVWIKSGNIFFGSPCTSFYKKETLLVFQVHTNRYAAGLATNRPLQVKQPPLRLSNYYSLIQKI